MGGRAPDRLEKKNDDTLTANQDKKYMCITRVDKRILPLSPSEGNVIQLEPTDIPSNLSASSSGVLTLNPAK